MNFFSALKNDLKNDCIYFFVKWTLVTVPLFGLMGLWTGYLKSDLFKHFFYGIFTFQIIFLVIAFIITLGPKWLLRLIINRKMLFVFFLTLLASYLINFDSELVYSTTLNEQMSDIINNNIGSSSAFVFFCIVFLFKTEQCNKNEV